MKILINRKPVHGPWGGGNNFVKAFVEVLPSFGHEIVHNFENNIDIIFIQDPRYDELGISINEAIQYKSKNNKCRIIQRINECDKRKNTKDVDSLLLQCSKYIDHTIFVSEWMKKYFYKKNWLCNSSSVLINGVANYYSPGEKIKNNKINIVTHHWSDNYMKGFDIYDKLDNFVKTNKDYEFTYIGRERGTFKNSKVIPPLFGKDLALELTKHDVYVSASRFDPGPNHILESLKCEIPTYSFSDGGGACEFTGESHVYDSFEDLEQILLRKNFSKNKFLPASWEQCIQELNENTLIKC